MSFKTGFESFFEKIGAELKKILANPNIEQQISTDLGIVAPLLSSILVFTGDAPAAAIVSEVVVQAQVDLLKIQGMVATYELGDHSTIKAAVGDALNDITTNLSGLLSAGHIKDEAVVAKVTAIINTIAGEAKAILAAL